MPRKFADMTNWERRMFGLGAFLVAAVVVCFRPDETLSGMHRLLGERFGR